MAEMTIRLDDEGLKAVENLKRLFGEKTANKAILKAISSYSDLKLEFERRDNERKAALGKIKEIQRAFQEREKWSEIMRKNLAE